MKPRNLKFNTQDRPEFFRELRSRANDYFAQNQLSKYANWNMRFKTVFMLGLYFVPLGILLSGQIDAYQPMLGLWALMGFGMSGIGLSIMHDANHNAYSSNQRVNQVLGFLLNFVGGYHQNWRIQHNVLHHTYTNVEGMDEDIQNKQMRFSPSRPLLPIYRYQAFYAPFLYGLMTLYWLLGKDYAQLKRYEQKNLLAGAGLTLRGAVREMSFHKTWYVGLTVVLPMVQIALPWWQVLTGFLLMQFISGLLLALIFQPAHVIEETQFFNPADGENLENNWAIHQLYTTANFAQGSRLFSWFIGGLNYQIEHHLFPNVCHVHYRALSAIVKQTATEYGLPYHQHPSFFGALRSHFSVLHQLGNNTYHRATATA